MPKKPKIEPQKLLELFNQGYSSVYIGKMFGLDHSTVLHHIHKFSPPKTKRMHIKTEFKYFKYGPTKEPPLAPKFEVNFLKEKLNHGKSYAEYLEDEKKRKLKSLLDKSII